MQTEKSETAGLNATASDFNFTALRLSKTAKTLRKSTVRQEKMLLR